MTAMATISSNITIVTSTMISRLMTTINTTKETAQRPGNRSPPRAPRPVGCAAPHTAQIDRPSAPAAGIREQTGVK